MKLIHCADLHLDSPMERNLTAVQARERGMELCRTFARMLDYGARQGVEAVLICGDLFDSPYVSVRVMDFVLEQIRAYPEMEFFCLMGNHDGGQAVFCREGKPENLFLSGPEGMCYRREKITITGMEPVGEQWLHYYDALRLNPEEINILMLHGTVSTQSGRELIALPKLRGRHIDYLALGHIHTHQSGKLDERGLWCYPGCLEGRGFDECGQKGFILMDVEENRLDFRFVPFASRILHEIPVDISGVETIHEMLSAMTRAAEDIPEKDLVKFVLRGEFSPDSPKNPAFLRKMLEGRFYAVKIADETRLRLNPEDYANDASLKGEFIRVVMASSRTQQEKEQIILLGLRALRGEEVAF